GSEHQTMCGDAGLATDKEAGIILEDDVAVGVEITKDLRRVRIVDPVPDQRGRTGLDEGGGFADADIEALPIDKRTVRGGNRQLRTRSGKRSRSLSDGGVEGVSERRKGKAAGHGENQHGRDPAPGETQRLHTSAIGLTAGTIYNILSAAGGCGV